MTQLNFEPLMAFPLFHRRRLESQRLLLEANGITSLQQLIAIVQEYRDDSSGGARYGNSSIPTVTAVRSYISDKGHSILVHRFFQELLGPEGQEVLHRYRPPVTEAPEGRTETGLAREDQLEAVRVGESSGSEIISDGSDLWDQPVFAEGAVSEYPDIIDTSDLPRLKSVLQDRGLSDAQAFVTTISDPEYVRLAHALWGTAARAVDISRGSLSLADPETMVKRIERWASGVVDALARNGALQMAAFLAYADYQTRIGSHIVDLAERAVSPENAEKRGTRRATRPARQPVSVSRRQERPKVA